MRTKPFSVCLFFALATVLFFGYGCGNPKAGDKDIAATPEELQVKTTDLIRSLVDKTTVNGKLNDSVTLGEPRLLKLLYEKSQFAPLWCREESWLPRGDSLFGFIQQSKFWGLFPEDYHVKRLEVIRGLFWADSLAESDKKNPALWSEADLLLTHSFVQLIRDIKLGRLPQDSVTLRKDSVLSDEFYLQQWEAFKEAGGITTLLARLEPSHKGYHLLKAGIKKFLDSSDYREYTHVPYPVKDSAGFRKALQKRLYEGGYLATDSVRADSAQLAMAVTAFQKQKGLVADGRAGEGTVRMLNVNDKEKFVRIAISMDRYKLLPEKMPRRYIWVNASSNYMEVVDGEEVKLSSKVICGKPRTRTPVLTSNITELITYPQWVPPPSIVYKEILPAVKRNPGYLARKGFSLVNAKGEEVDPYSVDWSKYSKHIPYRIVQGSGDANALGIMKFVFSNKYSVYLHDTNQRYLFANAMRSLSHGCVRVQEWEKLAAYILRNDSLQAAGSGGYTKMDSLRTWLGKKQKKSIPVRNKIPVYIRYVTCEGRNGGILFYDDVYGEDKWLREKYFAGK